VRIAEVAPMYEAVPPSRYGGTERVIAALCDELVTIGHDITLFAAAGSHTAATLVPTTDAPLRTRMSRAEMATVAPRLHLDMLADVYGRAADFDVIHAHTDVDTLPFAAATPSTPTVLTLHGRLDLPRARRELQRHPDVRLVSISRHQRDPVADLPLRWAATVPNGLDLRRYSNRVTTRAGHLLFVGRLNPEKRPDLAIEVARRAGVPLVIAAKVDPLDLEYFQTTVEPRLDDPLVQFVGEVDEDEKPALYAGAAATIFPSDWPEPFGLVMLESLAAGTPVLALRRGAVPEVIVDGLHGFVCDDADGLVEAVGRIDEIAPAECRRRARRFGARRMAARYLDVFERAAADTAGAEFVTPGRTAL